MLAGLFAIKSWETLPMAWIPVLRASSASAGLLVDAEEQSAAVTFADGSAYKYENVSSSAIHNLLNDKDLSVGEWINEHLKRGDVSCRFLAEI